MQTLPAGPQSPLLNKTADYSGYGGCMELVARIKRYWATKGLFPNVWAEREHTVASRSDAPTITYKVMSDMVGGWPHGQAR